MMRHFDMDLFRKNGMDYLFDNLIMFIPLFRE